MTNVKEVDQLAQLRDLTGTWRGDDGSVTYLRQEEQGAAVRIYWASTNVFDPPFSNIFIGYRLGSNITGQWIDVPQAAYQNIGVLTLEVIDAVTLRQVANTLDYNTRLWTKIRSGFPTDADTLV